MSTESSFIILRCDHKMPKVYSDDIHKIYEKNYYNLTDDADKLNKKVNINDIPKFIPFERFQYIDHFNNLIYDVIFNLSFNSEFSILLDEFNMNPYGTNNTIIISLSLAEKILEAINYILSEKYDRKFEIDVLENRYVKMFGELYPPYYNFYHDEKMELSDDYDSQLFIMKRIKIVLDAFIEMRSDDSWNDTEHVLIYTV